jgi:hypothetical protein
VKLRFLKGRCNASVLGTQRRQLRRMLLLLEPLLLFELSL